jgi:hypothetical protein
MSAAPGNERVEGREKVFVDRAVNLEPVDAGLQDLAIDVDVPAHEALDPREKPQQQ